MKLELADIATNEKKRLQGFKVLGIFPFYLRYIKTGTHIQLCKIREMLNKVHPKEISIEDFYSSEIQNLIIPLINKYCVTALVNNRKFSWFFKILLNREIKKCSHYHILNLFITITQLNQPAFFLSYWKLMKMKDNTILKEEEQS